MLDGAADDVTGLAPAFVSEAPPPAPVESAPSAPAASAPPAPAASAPRTPASAPAPTPPPARAPTARTAAPPVVLIDPSLAVLEWAKAALGAEFPRVHVFQRPGLGIDRIRQYLARAEIPLVVIAEDDTPDSAAGARDANEIVVR